MLLEYGAIGGLCREHGSAGLGQRQQVGAATPSRYPDSMCSRPAPVTGARHSFTTKHLLATQMVLMTC